ncbi:hypothetical protein DVH24_012514 [Malus domestica]|uniref:MADS-box domain-containing protein n=1 Tax=Malus domestica TaxID=3750 RepID=A0A498HQ00_MALDO|nr:hypothetical protein DVH24_012514 [Malus domestica]
MERNGELGRRGDGESSTEGVRDKLLDDQITDHHLTGNLPKCQCVRVGEVGNDGTAEVEDRSRGLRIRPNRQVTFSKRRNGLIKKAYEIATLKRFLHGILIFLGMNEDGKQI